MEHSWPDLGRRPLVGAAYRSDVRTGVATHPPSLAAINPWEGFNDAYRDWRGLHLRFGRDRDRDRPGGVVGQHPAA